jgi:ABC-2 type transport system permease protein
MNLAWAFFKRDAAIALSYRISFAVQFAAALLILGGFYYGGKTIGTDNLEALKPYGGSLVAFLLVGFGMLDWMNVSLTSFATQIREAQMMGTLEATLMSPVRLPVILVYSSLWNFFFSTVKLVIYLIFGGLLYGVTLSKANVTSAFVVFTFSVVCFMGLGIWWATTVLIVKRGESIMTILTIFVALVSGAMFPTSILPGWMQWLSQALPLTYSLDGMRLALLQGRTVSDLSGLLLPLGTMAVVFLTSGLFVFSSAVNGAKRTGSLTQY